MTSDCAHTGTSLYEHYGGKSYYYSISPFLPLHRAWVVVEIIWTMSDVDGWAVFDVRCDDVIPVSIVCGTGVLDLWGVGFDVEVLGMAQGMGNGIVGVSCFLRNRWFHKVILPDPSTLTWYKWLGRVSVTWPVVSHRRAVGHWIATICPFWRGHRVCAVLLYHSMRRVHQSWLSN